MWYLFQADKDLDVNFKFINIVNNCLDYIVPAVAMNTHKMNSRFGIITESINAVIVQCEKMISCLPKSQLKTAVESIERHLKAADKVASTACLTTGTADLISLKTSLPVIVSPVKSSTTRKRAPPNRTVPGSAIQEEERDDDIIIEDQEEPFSKKQKPSKTRVTPEDLDPDHYMQNTTLPVKRCYCGQIFFQRQNWRPTTKLYMKCKAGCVRTAAAQRYMRTRMFSLNM